MRSERRRRWTGVIVLAMALLPAACTSATPGRVKPPPSVTSTSAPEPIATDARTVDTGPVPVPRTGALVGAWVKPTTTLTQTSRIDAIRGLEHSIGRSLDIVNTYRRFSEPFPTRSDRAFADSGATLMVSWATGDTRQITSGQVDAQLVDWAHRFASYQHPILVRVRWEMDRPNLAAVMWSPADYVAAWKHIRAIFQAQHVTNVSWVWCPTIGGFANGTAPAFYPGDDQVDWTCVDVYAGSTLRPMSELLRPYLDWAAAHPKPIVIGEFGVAQAWGAPARAAWLRGADQVFRVNPQIKAICYFDSNPDGNVATQRFQLTDDADALAAFTTLARAPYFNPRLLPIH